MKTVVIFGGSGFVGSHIIRRIAKKGCKIIIPYQRSINEAKLRLFGNLGQIIPIKFENIGDDIIVKSVQNADVIINLKTVWQDKKLSFHKGIYQFNVDLIKLINEFDRDKLIIFFSGLGITKDSSSKRIRAIAETEEHIKKNSPNSSIIRPGIILGGGDQFLQKLMPVFQLSFFIPLFGNGNAKLQPVYVDDVAKVCEKIIIKQVKGNNIFELVGPEIFTYKSLYYFLSDCLKLNRVFVPIPFIFARIIVFFLQKITINLLNKEQLLLFKSNNLPSKLDKNFKYFNIQPQDIRQIIKISIDKII